MATDRQLRANRINAAKSTGPRTPNGKAESARNAITHGLTAQRVVLEWEDPAVFEQLRSALHDEFESANPTAFELVEHLAALLWRLRRSHAYEAALLTWITHQQAEAHDAEGMMLGSVFLGTDRRSLHTYGSNSRRRDADDRKRAGRMLEAAIGQKDVLSRLGRYEAHLQKQVEKVIKQLRHDVEVRCQRQLFSHSRPDARR